MKKNTKLFLGVAAGIAALNWLFKKPANAMEENINENFSGIGGGVGVSREAQENLKILNTELKNAGFSSKIVRLAIMATIGKESNAIPKFENGYSRTSNARIRSIFSRTQNLSDSQLNYIKADDVRFFNFVYDNKLGNGTGEGYKYRGSGYNQLTGKKNYSDRSAAAGVNLVLFPALNNNPSIAAKTAIDFFKNCINSTTGKSTLKNRCGVTNVNDIPTLELAVRYFCNCNTGIGSAWNGAKVNNAFNKAWPYTIKYFPFAL